MKTRRKRTVVHGEVDGVTYRAHFEGEPNPEARKALEELARAAMRCLEGTCEHPACVARRKAPDGR